MGWKLRMLQSTLTGDVHMPEEHEGEDIVEAVIESSFGAVVKAFFKFWIFGSILVSIATAMVREGVGKCMHACLHDSARYSKQEMFQLLACSATVQVQYWANAAAGAGVTLVMAYLNGNHIPNLLRFSTLITKFVGTICSVSAGLPMGPEVRAATVLCGCSSQASRQLAISGLCESGG
jgi:H+/Cl- antiporter ClcA